ncbi:MAG: TPM domain-containing protein [Treponema sp.]|nr:TPM domain-containing protein [Treponema sp.]
MNKNISKIFLLIVLICFTSPVFAQERIIDNANLLGASQKANLQRIITSIASQYKFDLVIVTERTIGYADPLAWADDFYDDNGYGFGVNRDGCLILQVVDSRDICVSTSGSGIDILNDYALNKVLNDAQRYLQGNNAYEAFNSFLANWQEFLSLDAKGGRRYNFFHQWNTVIVILAWALAFLIGFIVVHSWKAQMNTALSRTQAAAYIVPGSLSFRVKTDSFLYSTVTKTRRQTESSSSGGSGGGMRTSSSGRSHGGGGRKY